MKKLFPVLAVLVFAVSCKENTVPEPKNLLEQKQMENILYDVALIQSIKSFKPEVLDTNGVDPRKFIFEKYKIDSLTLAQNHTWYAADLEKYEQMQKHIVERLQKAKDSVNKLQGKPDAAKPGDTTKVNSASPGHPTELQESKGKTEMERRKNMTPVSIK